MTPEKKLANEIAKQLFTNGTGDHAKRLVLELDKKQDGGGWCESAVADVIERFLVAKRKKGETR